MGSIRYACVFVIVIIAVKQKQNFLLSVDQNTYYPYTRKAYHLNNEKNKK